ncbi:LuxR C-terminal-related transcriptional regulator [Microbacterium enclense]|uniref:helix-turn-helix transcriptional regulator n=1 Tax=Microbacterium enclense TaxID=993073 RepID=UPI00203F9F93|nr:LuxR C-terminal-related transcriptional regulator [Microbacterium enclense]MCM3613986.1 LuxR C-terminal-related transcriptional regulator [Microbacterium enclense]
MRGERAPGEPGADLEAAAAATVARLAPGHGIPLPRDLALLAETQPPAAPASWTDATATYLTACLAARARRDALGAGMGLITRYFEGGRLTRPGTLSPGVRSQLYASAGEYCNAIGWPQMGARFSAQALLFADTRAVRYRALSLAALGHALNGDHRSAEPDIAEAEELFAQEDWPQEETDHLLMLAHAHVAAARLDAPGLRSVSTRMTKARPQDSYIAFSAGAMEVVADMFSGDLAAARAGSRRLLSGTLRHSSHRMARHSLVCATSDLLVAEGEHREALALLEPYESPEGHSICFSLHRSAALLHLGRERDLLGETDACAAAGTDHCLRTLIPVLVRRALALNRLDHPRRARETMEAALLLIVRTGLSATPFLMLPHRETEVLVNAAMNGHDDLLAVASPLRAALARAALPDSERVVSATSALLTPSERALASLLVSPISLAQIARERGVSLNTVKSHVRSIYQKLGVRTRAEAVERLTGE